MGMDFVGQLASVVYGNSTDGSDVSLSLGLSFSLSLGLIIVVVVVIVVLFGQAACICAVGT